MSTYPLVEELPNSSEEITLLTIRRSFVSLLRLVSFLMLSLVVVTGAWYLSTENSFYQRFLSFLNPRSLLAIPLIITLEITRRLHNDVYILSTHRLTHKKGRLSLSYNVPVIRYEDIRAVNVVQDFWGRMFGYGDILVGTSAHAGNEIVMSGVKHPESLALLLDKLRSRSLSESSKIS